MCAVARLPLDIDRLYTNTDPSYVIWVEMVLDRWIALKKQAQT